MSKRTQSIRSMFAGGDQQVKGDEGRQPVQRVASGAVRSLKDTFSEVERDYEELKKRVANGALPVELDPATLDPSPFADRFAEQDAEAIETLIASIKEHGQEIPILVRVHPNEPGRYQIAYGHRRVRAASALGIPVKAVVQELDDDRLVLAQGVENSAREDLSFIERALFALKLEAAGFQRALVQSALSIDRAEVSKLVAVAQAISVRIIDAIGRAPKIGRGRWQELAELMKTSNAEVKAHKAIDEKAFGHKTSDERFKAVARALKAADIIESVPAMRRAVARTAAGEQIATLSLSAKQCKIQISRDRDAAFAMFVMEQLPDLYESFQNENPTSEG